MTPDDVGKEEFLLKSVVSKGHLKVNALFILCFGYVIIGHLNIAFLFPERDLPYM